MHGCQQRWQHTLHLRTPTQHEDPYSNEPSRLPALVVRSAKPFNAETPPELLADSLVTPNDLFYVRNHLPVPHLDAATHTVTMCVLALCVCMCMHCVWWTCCPNTLKHTHTHPNTPKHTHTPQRGPRPSHAAPVSGRPPLPLPPAHRHRRLQCAGNKRDAFNAVKEVKGLVWDVGAIGNATWTGVLLRDVLLEAGMREEDLRGVEHIQFEGADADMEGAAYGASIPVHKARDCVCVCLCVCLCV